MLLADVNNNATSITEQTLFSWVVVGFIVAVTWYVRGFVANVRSSMHHMNQRLNTGDEKFEKMLKKLDSRPCLLPKEDCPPKENSR